MSNSSDKVAWGVFKGLIAFFILLPLCIIAGCLMFAGIAAQHQRAEAQKAAEQKRVADETLAQRKLEIQKMKDAEAALESEKWRRELKAQEEREAERVRIEKAKQLESLFALRKQRALNGAPDACFDLGMMYLKGEGTETNSDLGLKYIRIAAQSGYGSAIEFMKSYDSRQ